MNPAPRTCKACLIIGIFERVGRSLGLHVRVGDEIALSATFAGATQFLAAMLSTALFIGHKFLSNCRRPDRAKVSLR